MITFRRKVYEWLWWYLLRKVSSDRIVSWLAWHLPRRLAYWCYIRVYSHANPNTPSAESVLVVQDWHRKREQ